MKGWYVFTDGCYGSQAELSTGISMTEKGQCFISVQFPVRDLFCCFNPCFSFLFTSDSDSSSYLFNCIAFTMNFLFLSSHTSTHQLTS